LVLTWATCFWKKQFFKIWKKTKHTYFSNAMLQKLSCPSWSWNQNGYDLSRPAGCHQHHQQDQAGPTSWNLRSVDSPKSDLRDASGVHRTLPSSLVMSFPGIAKQTCLKKM
jgi:hypothetical protein